METMPFTELQRGVASLEGKEYSFFFSFFFHMFIVYRSSDFSDLPDMTGEYII